MQHMPFKPYQDQPASNLEVELASNIVAVSGVVGSAPDFRHVLRARAAEILPITLMVNFSLQPFTPSPIVPTDFQTDLLLRWSSNKGGGEALLDASQGQTITVCAGMVELLASHKGNPVAGGAGMFQVAAFVGTVPHPPPIRTTRVDVAAGATSPRIAVPAWTTRVSLVGMPEPDALARLRGYTSDNAITLPLWEATGRNPIPAVGGLAFVDVTNNSLAARVFTVVSELVF